jgi:GDP-mannose 6-dehydrogenase
MKISIFGLGYVGSVSAACLANERNEIIGVDVNPEKAKMIAEGKSPIVEKEMDRLIQETVRNGRFKTTTSSLEAVSKTDLSLICVGTPSRDNGSINLDYLKRCSQEIGKALRSKNSYHTVMLRSTVLPGTVEETMIPILERHSGKKAGRGFGVASNPEFLREGNSVYDFYHPPFTLIGEYDKRSGDTAAAIYSFVDAPVERTDIRTAEMIKYVNNSFHALKVTFANEIGLIAKKLLIDSHRLMELFCKDSKLNLSSYYLKPGFAFGGPCLPKDLRALIYQANRLDLETPLLRSILASNALQVREGVNLILKTRKKKIGILGFSFKAGTDDLRESPIVELIETLLGKGLTIKIYDRNVSIATIFGSNRQFIEKEIPHISSMICSNPDEVTDFAQVLVIGNSSEEFREIIRKKGKGKTIIDLVRIVHDLTKVDGNYTGICW